MNVHRYQAHVDLIVREIAKFHAISFCMNSCPDFPSSGENLSEKFSLLATDSIYRDDTFQVGFLSVIPQNPPQYRFPCDQATNRAITPLMAGLAELIRATDGVCQHYPWFIHLAKVFN